MGTLKNLIFCSGLPRSGSTLLQNLLAQNSNHHCTATNDLLDCMMVVRDKWMHCTGFIAQGLSNIEPRIKSLMRGMLYGFYQQEFDSNKIVFDKSRGHLSQIELLEQIVGHKIKVIVPVRDLRDIVASFEKIYRKSVLTDHRVEGVDIFRRLTVEGRAERLLDIQHTIGYVVNTLQDAIDRELKDRLIIVPYRQLTSKPIDTIKQICEKCEIEPFTCDPSNIEQITKEDDTVYGMQLHTVRSVVEKAQENTWRGILPPSLADAINEKFASIQTLANQWRL